MKRPYQNVMSDRRTGKRTIRPDNIFCILCNGCLICPDVRPDVRANIRR
jgi:hypothetical protein